MKKRIRLLYILIALSFLLGAGFISYPFIGAFISDYTSTKAIMNYENQIQALNYDKIQAEKQKMKEINERIKRISGNPLIDLSAQEKPEKNNKTKPKKKTKRIYRDGEMLGYLSIPKIDCMLPIREGTREATLSCAIGHLSASSMPYGGKSTHCCLTGHSGLSYSTMFSNLNRLTNNDVFYIKVLNETHEYKVDRIRIVKPKEAEKYIQIEKGKDYVTLVTCTPVTVNTHRLLVRGHRIKYDKYSLGVDERNNKLTAIAVATSITAAVIIMSLITAAVVIHRRKNRRKR